MADYCTRCGNHLSVGDSFCSNCGKRIKIPVDSVGSSDSSIIKCPKCDGTGVVYEYRGKPTSIFGRGIGSQEYTCDVCQGKGKVRI